MFSPVIARGAVILLALASSSAAWAGPGSAAAEGDALRRAGERAPVASNPALSMSREAMYQHLKVLGIPTETLQWGIARIEGEAQQSRIDTDTIELLLASAYDAEGAEKAGDMLIAYAEMVAFGTPLTRTFDAQGAPRIDALNPGSGLEGYEIPPGAVDESTGAVPKIGGTCLTCTTIPPFTFDFGPFTPVAAWTPHSSALVAGFSDCAWYKFNVILGHHYEFSTCTTTTGGVGSSTFNTVLEAYDPLTSCVAFVARNDNDAACGTSTSTMLWDATYTGTLLVKLRGNAAGDGGAYTLAHRDLGITCESCVTPGAALPAMTAPCNCAVPSATTSSCPSKYYSVPLTMGETYTFTTCAGTCASAVAGFDTVLRVYDPACAFVTLNDDGCPSGPTTRSTVTFTATMTGTYKIQVTGRLLSTGVTQFGTFTLCGRRDGPACSTCNAGPYRLSAIPTTTCQSHASSVGLCQDAWYDFTLAAGRPYEFTTCNSLPCSAGAASFDTVLELRDAACGAVLVSADDNCAGTASKLLYTPAAAGNYRLQVRGSGNATGNYTLTYREVDLSCQPPASVTVGPASGAVAPNTCTRFETFNVSTDAAATTPITYNWTITPTTGISALPAAGVVVSPGPAGAPASFNSTLTGKGNFTVQVTAVNACGSFPRNIVYTLLDPQAPSLTVPANTTAECSSVPPPGTATTTDNCDASPAVAFVQSQSPGACPDAYTINRTWTATDSSGNSTSRTQVITVSDTTDPVLAGVPADANVECDAVPPPASPTASDNCDPAPGIAFAEVRVDGSCPGDYELHRTWTATDRCGNSSSQTQILVVYDNEPPVITPNDSQIACLWPPNHWYSCFQASGITVGVTDNCSLPITWTIVDVTSSSAATIPCGDGNQDPDVILAPDGQSFCVQSERCGQDTGGATGGRTYTVIATATDACGNVSAPTPVGTVFIPHDQRGGVACQRPDVKLR